MKILVVGGNGTIGRKVVNHLKNKHDVFIAGRSKGDYVVDISDSTSISTMFENIGKVDAIVNIAGDAKWDTFDNLTEEDYYIGVKSKLMGQVNLVRIGQHFLTDNGSITLSTGILADHPVRMTASAAMVNGGIHSFVKAVALELKRGIRLNVVSSGLVEDAVEKYQDYFPGHNAIPMNKVINGYVKSIEGAESGKVIRIYD
ncbi:MAG: short chain dehydrogenase [Saprospiraceae bacterium]|nr:short chain dehydrogenase [Saprospiraceae bacterium]